MTAVVDAILRARMGSTRLPGKVLLPAAGKPLLQHLVERLRRSRRIRRLVVATSVEPGDDPIAELCEGIEADCFRGSADDVLDRYYRCSVEYGIAHIAIMYSDNPLLDPAVVDTVAGAYQTHVGQFDFVSNCRPFTYPDGMEVELCSFAALEAAWRDSSEPFQREHVTPFIWGQPERFRCHNVTMTPDLHARERWTLDYPEDYDLVRTIFERLKGEPYFGMLDVLRLLDAEPGLRKINSEHAGLQWWDKHAAELPLTKGW